MTSISSKIGTAAMALALATAPTLAAAANPVGTWQTTSGESRYQVSYCGNGEQICAVLTWLREDARTPENLAYLNTLVVNGAVPASANQWKGKVSYDGQTFSGSMTLTGENNMQIKGCKIICKSLSFERI